MAGRVAEQGNPFGLSDSDAARVRINALQILYTLKAEQDKTEGRISVREITRKRKRKERMSA